MAKSIEQLNQQIAKLQQQVEAVKAKEASGVIARIREAIEHYGLTPDQLFGQQPKGAARKAKSVNPQVTSKRSSQASGALTRTTGRVKAKGGAYANDGSALKTSEKKAARSSTAGVKLPAKYADENGNSWTGRGSTPRWLAEAIASGKSKEDFAVKG